jgi:Cft2 family RNA processing exonuclease
MQVFDKNGIFLPDFDLWLDPHSTKEVAFVSHAHGDHMKKHSRVYATPATSDMMFARGATKSKFHHLAWGEKVPWGSATVSFYPAGHVLGSAQILVEADGTRLLYSGDFKMRDSLTSEKIEVPKADIIVMETTFGKPRYEFPETVDVLRDICNWCHTILNRGEIPVLFSYSLGKGQEVLSGLQQCDFPIYLHAKHAEISHVYARHGIEFPLFYEHKPFEPLDGVLLCSSICKRSAWWHDLEKRYRLRTAYISGWALDGGPWRFKTNAAFPLSDHAGYSDLHEYVRQSGAQQVWTTHGFAHEFAHDLRAIGIDASPLKTAKEQSFPKSKAAQLSLF